VEWSGARDPAGKGAHDICISESAGKAYIAAEGDNMVAAVDIKTLDIEWIPVGPLPHHVEPSTDGRFIYVSLDSHPANPSAGVAQVAVIDTKDHSVSYITTSLNPLARAHGPRLSRNGDTLYVAHDTGSQLTGIDLDTGSVDLSVTPIVRAEEAVPTRDGHYLWVSSRGDGTVKRIDLTGQSGAVSVPVGVQPESVMLAPPSDRTLVVSLRGGPATLAFVDTVDLDLESSVQIGGVGTFGDLAVISRNGRFVYATFDATAAGQGGVAVVDVRSRTVVATWEYPGGGRPHGIWHSSLKPDVH
jgi:DNA-binding beta-propeller fold protein YncE